MVLPFACGLGLAALVIGPLVRPDAARRLHARLRFGAEPSPGGLVLEVERLRPDLATGLDRGPSSLRGDRSWVIVWIVNAGRHAVPLGHHDEPGPEMAVEVTPQDGQPPPSSDVPPNFDPVSEARPVRVTWLAPGGRVGVPFDLGPWLAGRAPGRYDLVVTRAALGDPRVGLDGPARSAPFDCRID